MKLHTNTSGKNVYSRFEYPIAAKDHKCTMRTCWHGGIIRAGDQYVKVVSIFSGQVHTSKYHYNCHPNPGTISRHVRRTK